METGKGDDYGAARLVLDYIRTFIWPTVLAIVLLFYKDDVLEIVKTREIEVGTLKIGQRVNDLNQNVQAELADLRTFVEEIRASASDRSKVKDLSKQLADNIEVFEANLNKDIAQIQQETVTPQLTRKLQTQSTEDPRAQAQNWELKGFEYILSKDVDAAIEAFTKAEISWPAHHNVAEIKRLLVKNRDALGAARNDEKSAPWGQLYRTLLSEYSWGMPTSIRISLREKL